MSVSKHRDILNIIQRIRESHSSMVDIFSFGSCFNFFLILRAIYPEARPWSDKDHIITQIDRKFYDIGGVVKNTQDYKLITDYHDNKIVSKNIKEMMDGEYKI